MLSTSLTLLHQLRNIEDQIAWNRFVHLYTPLIYSWVRRVGLDAEEASDMVQDVFAILVQKLPDFEHDRTNNFRAWLKTVVLNRWRDHLRRRKVPTAHFENLDELPANEYFDERIYKEILLNRSLKLLQHEFRSETWNAFLQHGVERQPAAKVANELGLTLGAVYAARSRVMARIREFLAGLID